MRLGGGARGVAWARACALCALRGVRRACLQLAKRAIDVLLALRDAGPQRLEAQLRAEPLLALGRQLCLQARLELLTTAQEGRGQPQRGKAAAAQG